MMRSRWFWTLGGMALVGLLLAPPASGQQPRGGGKEKAARTLEVFVDGTLKRTWRPEELAALPRASWKNRRGKVHQAVGLWAVVTESGVSRNAVAEIRVRDRSGEVLALKGDDDLADADKLVLRSGRADFGRPIRLAALDPALEPERGALLADPVQRIDVVTKEAAARAAGTPKVGDALTGAEEPKGSDAPKSQ